jgi:hypothetical protein
MTARRDPDQLIHRFLLEGSERLDDQIYDAVREAVDRKPQRVVIGPWRTPFMSKFLTLGLGAAAVVVALVVGPGLLGSSAPPGPGGNPSREPSASAKPSPSLSPSPEASPAATAAPALTQTFTSQRHGVSMSYPTGWETRPATEPWATGVPDFFSPAGDIVFDPVRESNLWIVVASQSVVNATPEEWVAEKLAFDDGCTSSEPIDIDEVTGGIGVDECSRAAVTIDGLGYFFWLYTGDGRSLAETYDRAWFEEVLATVQLRPEEAVDAASSAGS